MRGSGVVCFGAGVLGMCGLGGMTVRAQTLPTFTATANGQTVGSTYTGVTQRGGESSASYAYATPIGNSTSTIALDYGLQPNIGFSLDSSVGASTAGSSSAQSSGLAYSLDFEITGASGTTVLVDYSLAGSASATNGTADAQMQGLGFDESACVGASCAGEGPEFNQSGSMELMTDTVYAINADIAGEADAGFGNVDTAESLSVDFDSSVGNTPDQFELVTPAVAATPECPSVLYLASAGLGLLALWRMKTMRATGANAAGTGARSCC